MKLNVLSNILGFAATLGTSLAKVNICRTTLVFIKTLRAKLAGNEILGTSLAKKAKLLVIFPYFYLIQILRTSNPFGFWPPYGTHH